MSIQEYENYFNSIREKYSTAQTTEQSFYNILESFIEKIYVILGTSVLIIQIPKKTEAGLPDFLILRKIDKRQIGYIEAKALETNLTGIIKTKQLTRYRESFPNFILTNYSSFTFFKNGKKVDEKKICDMEFFLEKGKLSLSMNEILAFENDMKGFLSFTYRKITTPKALAIILARKTHILKEIFQEEADIGEETKKEFLLSLYKMFKETLNKSMTIEQFSDLIAQTITYGLFFAKTETKETNLELETASWSIPKSLPILQNLFYNLTSPQNISEHLRRVLEDVINILNNTEMEAIFQKFQSEKWTDDPAIHFYETFLKEYDPKIRIRKGVFYTPVPVVSYIINSIHSILKKDFNLINGLAENNVTLLDPAAGTLTFPLTAIKKIKQELINQNKEGLFTSVVKDHILKNFFAFEILLAPYTIAHFKVCLTLRNLGYQIKDEDRFSLFLTNTLEKEAITQQDITLLPLIARESREAMKVKEEVPIQVVCANPPYSVSSENKSTFIEGLMDDYKKDVKEERNIQPLSDDYIKFIRFAQWKIEQTGEGIIGYITNNEYLSGLIHRGMRKELFEIFDKIYVLNLHGDLRKGDTSLGNKKDENVFDIKKGVTIAFFIKNSKINQKQVFYADLFGTQKEKYFYLSNNDVCTTKWETIKPKKPFYFFIPQEDNKQIEKIYDNFSSITEIFKKYGSGIKTHRDNFLVADSSDEIKKRLTDFVETKISDDDLKRQYNLRDTGTWNVNDARRKFRIVEVQEDKFRNYDYRPFCIKWTYLSDVLMDRPRGNELQDVNSQNPALVTTRQLAYLPFHHTFVTNKLADICLISLRTKESSYIFPLYLFLDEKRVSNIKESIIQQIKKSFNKDIDSIDVFNYIYAILNCRKFRTKYAAFLKINFPRIPFTSDYKIFLKLIKLGAKLKDTHLLNLYSDEEGKIGYPNDGTNIINEIRYDKKNHHLYINDTQYFDGILNEEWNFFIGGHKILYGWLKDMKNKKLSSDEIRYFIKIIASIKETIKIMRLLDTLYDKIEKNIMPIKTTTQKLFNNL